MKREIQKEHINWQIIEKLKKIGYDQFNQDLNDSKASYETEFIFDCGGKKFLFKVEFWMESNKIKKDSEYYGIDTATHKEEQFKARACSDRSQTLQEMFDEWEVSEWKKSRKGFDIDSLPGGRDYNNDKENMSC